MGRTAHTAPPAIRRPIDRATVLIGALVVVLGVGAPVAAWLGWVVATSDPAPARTSPAGESGFGRAPAGPAPWPTAARLAGSSPSAGVSASAPAGAAPTPGGPERTATTPSAAASPPEAVPTSGEPVQSTPPTDPPTSPSPAPSTT